MGGSSSGIGGGSSVGVSSSAGAIKAEKNQIKKGTTATNKQRTRRIEEL
jgi:hypothetical protein